MNQPRLFETDQHEYTKDDYWTPAWVFDALGLEFDIDVACPPDGSPHCPCKHYYTQKTDGLSSPWWGRVWMNPPFSRPEPWVRKFAEHGNGVGLVATSKARWFDELWRIAPAIVLLPSNLKFDQGGIFMPSVLFAWGDDNIEALNRVGHVR